MLQMWHTKWWSVIDMLLLLKITHWLCMHDCLYLCSVDVVVLRYLGEAVGVAALFRVLPQPTIPFREDTFRYMSLRLHQLRSLLSTSRNLTQTVASLVYKQWSNDLKYLVYVYIIVNLLWWFVRLCRDYCLQKCVKIHKIHSYLLSFYLKIGRHCTG